VGNDVAGEYGVVLLDCLGHDFEKFLHVIDEVLVEVVNHTADAVVIECHARAASLLEYVEYAFALAQGIEQHGGSTEVHTECAHEQEMRADTH
jgi:hypothetical protein